MDHSSSHDFDSISPSAYALLMMKGHTPIPYAQEAARLLRSIAPSMTQGLDENSSLRDILDPASRKPEFWARALHFESRYFGIDQLLSDLTATNILELSSGFSFRGLALSRRQPVFYIDTDLPGLIATKQRFVEALAAAPRNPAPGIPSPQNPALQNPAPLNPAPENPAPLNPAPQNPATATAPPSAETSGPNAPPPAGHYELHPLNALDTAAFEDIVRRFPPGDLTIINEGLLVYLDTSEKERLCNNIRTSLLQRGGCWITGDIYIKSPTGGNLFTEKNDAFREFLEQHHIEENKFDSFDAARDFFSRAGFLVEREATIDFTTLSSLPRLLGSLDAEQMQRLQQAGRNRIHAVWRLRPA